MYLQEERGLQASRRDLRAAIPIRLQGFHSAFHRRALRRPPLGRTVSQIRSEVRRAGGRTSRRLSHVRLQLHRMERRQNGTEARRRGRTGGGGARTKGLHFGASSHRAEHWWFYNGGMKFDSDVRTRATPASTVPRSRTKTQPDEAYLNDWLARTTEIVDKYQPELVWFDWWIEQPVFQPYLQKFAAFYYNRGAEWKRGVAINYKNEVLSRARGGARHRARSARRSCGPCSGRPIPRSA